MARISTYPLDQDIVGEDKVIGSNSVGDITKNYTFKRHIKLDERFG